MYIKKDGKDYYMVPAEQVSSISDTIANNASGHLALVATFKKEMSQKNISTLYVVNEVKKDVEVRDTTSDGFYLIDHEGNYKTKVVQITEWQSLLVVRA